MASVDAFGEKILKVFERLYLLVLDLLIKAVISIRGVAERIKRLDRERIYPFFERRDIEPEDYSIFKLEISSALFLVLSMLYIFNYISGRQYIYISGSFLTFSLYILFTTIKKEFEDYVAYKEFFLPYLTLAVLLAVIKVKKPVVNTVFPLFHFVVIALLGAVAISLNFRKKYSRNYTYGRVIEGGADAKVKFSYDLRSDVKPHVGIFKNTLNTREGDTVKVMVKKGFLSIRGSTPVEIIGVEWS